MADMTKIHEFVLPVRSMTRSAFVSSHPYPFLLLRLREYSPEDEWSFLTTTVDNQKLALAKLMSEEGLSLSSDLANYRAYALVKGEGILWRERISVGRARNNDISLPHRSVSKLHAHFTLGPDGTTVLSDVGSRNGTRLNDEKLEVGREVRARPGDTIVFGAVSLTFLDPEKFYDFVQQHIQS